MALWSWINLGPRYSKFTGQSREDLFYHICLCLLAEKTCRAVNVSSPSHEVNLGALPPGLLKGLVEADPEPKCPKKRKIDITWYNKKAAFWSQCLHFAPFLAICWHLFFATSWYIKQLDHYNSNISNKTPFLSIFVYFCASSTWTSQPDGPPWQWMARVVEVSRKTAGVQGLGTTGKAKKPKRCAIGLPCKFWHVLGCSFFRGQSTIFFL